MSGGGFRQAEGGRIDRSRQLGFTFDGHTYRGFHGDTLASALLANGVRVAARSFKYHRPRGLIAAGVEESNVLVQLGEGADSTPNLRATEIELYDGLVARPVNCWPSARFDLGAVNSLVGRFLPAGFYYKTFMWPHWHLYEAVIRRAAGLGKAADEADPAAYDERYAHCDVLVVGGGGAGLAAARAAAAQGARVILCEQDRDLGGRLLWDEAEIDGQSGAAWVEATARELADQPDVRVLTRTTVAGYFDHNEIVAVETPAPGAGPRTRLWQIRARQVILATGALERPLVFPGNDRPGVMLATAAQQYLRRYGVLPGRKVAVFTNNDDSYALARALADAGALAALIDSRPSPTSAGAWLELSSAVLITGGEVVATHGGPALSAIEVRTAEGQRRRIACDGLAVSGGFNPTIHLHCQSGGKPQFDEARAMFVPGPSVQAETSVGAAAGQLGLAQAMAAGHEAGLSAGGGAAGAVAAPRVVARSAPQISPLWRVHAEGKAFVDFQNDVTVADIELAARENFVSVEHLKRYTTLGMAPDQGKTSNVNALAIMAGLTDRSIPETGTTRYRFPYTPIALGAFTAGRRGALLRPLRHMPAHERHLALNARLEDYGGYLRPTCYLRAGESVHAAEQREAVAVRQRAGLFEGSPLGKIEVVGPDAGEFLDRIYANTMSTLKPGRARYGLMLNELGVVIDDGVTARIDDQRFLVGTSGAGADRIAAWLEEWRQCEWPDLRIIIAPVTTAWGVVTIAGPKAREIIAAAGCDIDLDPAAFPHMSFREGSVGAISARVYRVSFTGEVSYEINVPAGQTAALWDRLIEVGGPLGLEPVGIEAWMLLRTEKGYIHVGADTDGSTSPDDIGWGHVLKRDKDFVGRRSLTRSDNLRTDRLQLVGLEAVGSAEALAVGVHVRGRSKTAGTDGYVTSAGFSPTLGRGVALAMIHAGRSRIGEEMQVLTDRGPRTARVIQPGVFDPKGERLNA